jgi:hypothetical protein
MSAALADLRSYVTADTGAQNRAESTVLLSVTHSNLRAVFMELRFDLHVRARHAAPRCRAGHTSLQTHAARAAPSAAPRGPARAPRRAPHSTAVRVLAPPRQPQPRAALARPRIALF